MSQYKKLKQALLEDGISPIEAEDLAHLDKQLSQAALPKFHAEATANLMAVLRQEIPPRKTAWEAFLENYAIALLLSQVRVIQRELWLASALLLLLGTFVTLANLDNLLFSFSMLAPIVAAAGVAMLFDDDFQAMLDIEETSRASARLLLLARLTLVFGFNLVLALLGSVILAAFDGETLLLPLISSWLAPMSFLSGLAFYLSIMGGSSLFAGSFSLVLWMGHLIFSNMPDTNIFTLILSMPGLSEPTYRPLLLLLGLLLIVVALWQVGVMERGQSQVDNF